MNEILITVSGIIPDDIEQQVAAGLRPQADYLALAQAFEADLLDYGTAREESGGVGRLLERIGGPNLVLAWAAYRRRRRYRVIFTDGEQVGLPLAALLKAGARRRPQHAMIVHRISARKKTLLVDNLHLYTHIDRFLCYASWQRDFILQRWGLPPERAVFTPFMVDDCFFSPQAADGQPLPDDVDAFVDGQPMICAVGLEHRDYPTLLAAVDGLPLRVVLAAASPWSKQPDTTAGQHIPANVLVRRFTQLELRALAAYSRFAVMPLYPVDFQAGVTALLEAMAMERAVICTQTPGQTDVVREGETGLYVPPGDAAALRSAIEGLLAQPGQARQMGRNGRKVIEQEMSLTQYTRRLKEYVAG